MANEQPVFSSPAQVLETRERESAAESAPARTPPAPIGSSTPTSGGNSSPTDGFSGPHTAKLVGISYRQLDHWTTKGLIRSSLADAAGSGSRRRYSYSDLVELKIAKKMRDQGIDLKSIAKAFDYLRDQLGGDVSSANIVISGDDVLLVDEDQVLSLLRQGQAAMLTVLPVAGVRRELYADVVRLFPDEPISTQLSLDLVSLDLE
ncbi:MerR family transcriptional regulator [Candidatus Poriferisodalis sp.]|uniref:MerR family transcriptional regulator n=1 Tax=Candidatus Poriferisodalis sp. TaxID=3101277 RepID=UPI003B023629